MSDEKTPRPGMSRLLAIATLGLSAGIGPAALPDPAEASGGGEVPECAVLAEPRQAAPATARDKLPYLFWV